MQREAALSNARVVIDHLLKLAHSPAQDPRNGRLATVREHRAPLKLGLTPKLRQAVQDELPRIYAIARRNAEGTLRDHGEPAAADALPALCPYTLDQLIDDWWPWKRWRQRGVRAMAAAKRFPTPFLLARYFGTSAEFWLGMQTSYDLELARERLRPEIDAKVQPRATSRGVPIASENQGRVPDGKWTADEANARDAGRLTGELTRSLACFGLA